MREKSEPTNVELLRVKSHRETRVPYNEWWSWSYGVGFKIVNRSLNGLHKVTGRYNRGVVSGPTIVK